MLFSSDAFTSDERISFEFKLVLLLLCFSVEFLFTSDAFTFKYELDMNLCYHHYDL